MQENSSWYIFFKEGWAQAAVLGRGFQKANSGIWMEFWIGKFIQSHLWLFYTRWKCFKSSPWFIAKCTPWVSVSEHSQDSECWLRDIFISQWSHEEILSACSRHPFPKQRRQTKVMLFLCEIPAQLSHSKNTKISCFPLKQRHWSVMSSFSINIFKLPWSFWCHWTWHVLFGMVFKSHSNEGFCVL